MSALSMSTVLYSLQCSSAWTEISPLPPPQLSFGPKFSRGATGTYRQDLSLCPQEFLSFNASALSPKVTALSQGQFKPSGCGLEGFWEGGVG